MMPATPASFTCCIMFSFSSPFSSFASTITGVAGTLRAAAGWLWLTATKRRLAGATPRLNDAAVGSKATNTVPTRAETRMARRRSQATLSEVLRSDPGDFSHSVPQFSLHRNDASNDIELTDMRLIFTVIKIKPQPGP